MVSSLSCPVRPPGRPISRLLLQSCLRWRWRTASLSLRRVGSSTARPPPITELVSGVNAKHGMWQEVNGTKHACRPPRPALLQLTMSP